VLKNFLGPFIEGIRIFHNKAKASYKLFEQLDTFCEWPGSCVGYKTIQCIKFYFSLYVKLMISSKEQSTSWEATSCLYSQERDCSINSKCITFSHGINTRYQHLGSPLHQKQDMSNTARSWEPAFYVLHFNISSFNPLHVQWGMLERTNCF
jgi:hypothetical protein